MSIQPTPYIRYQIPRTGGKPELTYYILSENPSTAQAPWFIILQGSSADSTAPGTLYAHPQKSVLARLLVAADAPVVLIEKPGVTEDRFEKECYNRYNTVDQRAEDVETVINDLKKHFPHNHKGMVLIGISEGGEVLLRTLPLLKKNTSVAGAVLISWISPQDCETRIANYMLDTHIPRSMHGIVRPLMYQYVRYQFKCIAQHPQSISNFFRERSYRYWSTFKNQLAAPESLLTLHDTPICIIDGGKDSMLAGSKTIIDSLKAHHLDLTHLHYPTMGHRLESHVYNDLVQWFTHKKVL